MASKGAGLARLATHALVLGLTLLGATLAPLALHQDSAETVVAEIAPRSINRSGIAVSTVQAPSSVRPGSVELEATRIAPPRPAPAGPTPASTTDLAENLHHLGRFIWPAHGTITTYFWAYHPGIDIANVEGTAEVAADAGRVVVAGWGAYGIYVEIDHGNGFHTIYGHMSGVLVQVGQLVTPGQEIGLMGSTGRSTGPHLHFEIRYQDVPQNPLDFLQ